LALAEGDALRDSPLRLASLLMYIFVFVRSLSPARSLAAAVVGLYKL
jgi:hypothetical protein